MMIGSTNVACSLGGATHRRLAGLFLRCRCVKTHPWSKDALLTNGERHHMKTLSALPSACFAAALLLAGCADQPTYQSQSQYPDRSYPAQSYPAQSQSAYIGTVDRIEVIGRKDPNNIAGTVIGGIIGGLIGHQIGGGTGNTVATIAGAA